MTEAKRDVDLIEVLLRAKERERRVKLVETFRVKAVEETKETKGYRRTSRYIRLG